MSELRLHAVDVDEVRAIFGADPTLAERLRQAAKVRWFDHTPEPRRGVLDRLGPLTTKALLPATPDMPTRDDADTLLAGRYVAPERTLPAWRLVEGWIGVLAHDSLQLQLSAAELDALDEDLVAAGLGADLAPGAILRRDPHLPLRPLPGMFVGHATHPRVLATADDLRRCRDDVAPRSRERAQALADFFAHAPTTWQERAAHEGRPAPGVVALWFQ